MLVFSVYLVYFSKFNSSPKTNKKCKYNNSIKFISVSKLKKLNKSFFKSKCRVITSYFLD